MTEIDTHEKRIGQLEAMLEAMLCSVVAINANGGIESVNSFTSELFGYTEAELMNQNVKMLMPEAFAAEHDGYLSRYINTGHRRIIGIGREVTGRHKDGFEFPVHLSIGEYRFGQHTFFVGIMMDLSLQKRAEADLLRAQKNEAVGRLSGGIAHDFNNILTIIIGNLELLELKDLDEDSRHLLHEALNATESGSHLAHRLLAFARKTSLEPKLVNFNEAITSVTDIVSRTLGKSIEFSTQLEEGVWQCRIDPSQLESALLNLALNSRDAMPDGGRLVIETRNIAVDANFIAAETELEQRDYVALSVSDTGHGMEEHQRLRAFDPFFTTKPVGKGTGLGLSVLRGFVEQSGGLTSIYSEPGLGTTVTIYLPRARDEDITAAPQPKPAALSPRAQSNPATDLKKRKLILVVEDEPKLLRLTTERLQLLGFRTLQAESAAQAQQLLAEVNDIDLVFTDIVMPGEMSGYDLAKFVRSHFPSIAVLMTSGFAEDAVHPEKLSKLAIRLLRKPYRLDRLKDAVIEAFKSS